MRLSLVFCFSLIIIIMIISVRNSVFDNAGLLFCFSFSCLLGREGVGGQEGEVAEEVVFVMSEFKKKKFNQRW